MSGTPTEAEIQAQWRNLVDVLETSRAYFDGTVVGAGNLLDTLVQSIEGEYTPALSGFASRFRSGCSALVDPGFVQAGMQSILYEYGRFISSSGGFGGGYANIAELMRAIYEHFVDNSLTVESRNITFDTTATAGASNVGNGAMSRLTVDENGFDLEACHVETKTFRCRRDQNSGAEEHAESFEVFGEAQSQDSLLRASFGSGESQRTSIISRHAGSGRGGSLLRNSSFSTFDASSETFAGWTKTGPSSVLSQDLSTFYRSFPNAQSDASMRILGGSGTVTLKQTINDSRSRRLDPNRPYFLRAMVNKSAASALGGSVTIRLGSTSATATIASLSSGWNEIAIPLTEAAWFRSFNEDALDVEIEWSGSTSGTLLVDDVIFTPFDLVDGTYWILRQNAASPTSWLVDDTLTFTDTGGAPATAKIQWWLFATGLGYLPSTTGTPTFTEPT